MLIRGSEAGTGQNSWESIRRGDEEDVGSKGNKKA
jgi:hypothetical protein